MIFVGSSYVNSDDSLLLVAVVVVMSAFVVASDVLSVRDDANFLLMLSMV